jgi:hypothetical protein
MSSSAIDIDLVKTRELIDQVCKDIDKAIKDGNREIIKQHQVEVAKILKMLADAGVESAIHPNDAVAGERSIPSA